jgi:anti-sigma regulatory factor (Ser/Thr protein kinase)
LSRVSVTVPSAEVYLEPVQVFVERVGRLSGVEEDELTSLSIAVIELVKNAMEHGNGLDPLKEVDMTMEDLPGRLQITVVDQGCWKPECELGYKPGEGEELYSDRGRGILIARNLARWVDFGLTDDGRTRAVLIWPLT